MTPATDTSPMVTNTIEPAADIEIVQHDTRPDGFSRCDTCGPASQAYVSALVNGSDLHFCAHHYGKYEIGLLLSAQRIDDHRPFLALQEGGKRDAASAV